MPFFFVIDFLAQQPVICSLDDLSKENIRFQFPNANLDEKPRPLSSKLSLQSEAISLEDYEKSFAIVKDHIHFGNSYLVNLTCETKVELPVTLHEIFSSAAAPYKLLFKDEWVCFSPECFIKIQNGIISSYPMKGTIDESIPDAAGIILKDEKELAEHYTIVDLIRNDLSAVANNVRVEKFRYIDKVKTSNKTLLQVSSKISGTLPEDYTENIGSVICSMLPAGSVTGAPKPKTIDIIKESERYNRGFYTGVAGYFDGKNLDSCVLIRFIQKKGDGYTYKSGGGITIFSDSRKEYNEMLDKIYVPVN